MDASAQLQNPDRLNGWKEIATFLGKGVRTAQRWESELDLPVHRVGRDGGEIVVAFKSEISAWTLDRDRARRSKAPASTGGAAADGIVPDCGQARPDRRSHRPAVTLTLTAVVVTAVILVAINTAWVEPLEQPVSWRVSNDTLEVFDGNGAQLWSQVFPGRISEVGYGPEDPFPGGNRATIVDLDGDGSREVVFGVRFVDLRGPVQGVFVYNSDGSPRFDFRPDGGVHFGAIEYRPPWVFYRLFVTQRTDGSPSLWVVFTHGMDFPSLLVELDPAGQVKSRYWSNGFIDKVVEATWDGRPSVIVGATNNESRGASLAIFDREHVTGAAPAIDAGYRCVDCPAGAPLEFIIFPRRCIARASRTQATIDQVWVDSGGRLHVSVVEQSLVEPYEFVGVWYWLDAWLMPLRVELWPALLRRHRDAELSGLLDHSFGRSDEADLFPVRRWNGSRFVDLPPAPVAR